MQEDLKDQWRRAIGQWRKKGQTLALRALQEAQGEMRSYLAQQGLAERWPALVSLAEEVWPDLASSVATLVGQRLEPLARYLNAEVTHWQPYQIVLKFKPSPHLLSKQSWEASSMVAMGELAGRWLLEKHVPPGDLKIFVHKVEVERLQFQETVCTARCELNAEDFERTMAELLKNQRCEIYIPVLIFSENDVLLSQVNFHFELHWSALLK